LIRTHHKVPFSGRALGARLSRSAVAPFRQTASMIGREGWCEQKRSRWVRRPVGRREKPVTEDWFQTFAIIGFRTRRAGPIICALRDIPPPLNFCCERPSDTIAQHGASGWRRGEDRPTATSLVGSRSPPLTTSFGISAFDMSRGAHPQLRRCRRECTIFRIDELPIIELRTY
jgi:hypothetical protein